ncbi:Puromycin resistance protein pur8 [Lachnellula arida]|uniref:Puromycin resistance protein pur8 n=1 Tax=Lachnellula arida TaxID=1316785 RepID=A0A8T9BPU4_9HELO|nr:Puromycin resistance protein pur8 [Lachnellula arida]
MGLLSVSSLQRAILRQQENAWLILAVVCSAMFLDLANLSAITIALPTLRKEFSISTGNLQWIISAYALTFGAFLMLGGRGGDIFGHRPMLLFGMSFFALFTLVSALTPTFIGLVIARAFQGIGAAFTIPSAQAHIAIHFPDPAMKASALGIWGASGSLGFIIGLILGGILTDLLGWRWIFWASLIFSGVVTPAAYLFLPAGDQSRHRGAPSPEVPSNDDQPKHSKPLLKSIEERLLRFDAPGILLGLPGIITLTYALTSSNQDGWDSPPIISTLVVSIFLLFSFVLYERQAASAILPTHLFKSSSFNLTLILAINTYAVRQACTYFLTVQLQSFGNSPIHTSVLFIPLGVSALISNTIAGRLVPILGARVMFILGWSLSIPGVLLFSFIEDNSSYWRFTFPAMILYIAGIGAVYITANFVVVSSASKSDQGAAAGVFNVALQVGGSILGLAVLTAIAQGIEKRFGPPDMQAGGFSHVAYQSVYYSCIILCVVGLVLSIFFISVPDSMTGSIWKRNAVPAATNGMAEPSANLFELQGRTAIVENSRGNVK